MYIYTYTYIYINIYIYIKFFLTEKLQYFLNNAFQSYYDLFQVQKALSSLPIT